MEGFYTLEKLHNQAWFQKLSPAQKELLQQSFFILEDIDLAHKTFYDYSFVVMPAAKAYEGFVKDLFLELKLISETDYGGRRFRVGKALNPQLAQKIPNKKNILHDDLQNKFPDKNIGENLWQTWKRCRNRVFHYFVKDRQHISLAEAKQRLQQIIETIAYVDEVVTNSN